MPRRWNPSFHNPYSKFWYPPDRLNGERAYDDHFKKEKSPGLLNQPEPDYEFKIKPYQPAERSESAKLALTEPINAEHNPLENELASIESEIMKPKKKENMEKLETGPTLI